MFLKVFRVDSSSSSINGQKVKSCSSVKTFVEKKGNNAAFCKETWENLGKNLGYFVVNPVERLDSSQEKLCL